MLAENWAFYVNQVYTNPLVICALLIVFGNGIKNIY